MIKFCKYCKYYDRDIKGTDCEPCLEPYIPNSPYFTHSLEKWVKDRYDITNLKKYEEKLP